MVQIMATSAPQGAPDNSPADTPAGARRLMPAVGAALSMTVLFIASLAIPVGAALELELSAGETTAWIMAAYGVAAVLGLILSVRYRQPLMLTGNIFVLIFIARLGTDVTWPELVGSSMVAGLVVLVLGPLGLTKMLVAWLPGPIVFGILAGAVLPFVVNMFTELGNEPVLVGGTVAAYLLAQVTLEPRVPAILPALAVALLIAAVAGDLGSVSMDDPLPAPVLTMPEFSLGAILTVTPVMVVLITVQANIPSIVFLREQAYDPPEKTIGAVSGVGTMAGSLLGPTGISLSLPATALCGGPDAGDRSTRYLSVSITSVAAIVVALFAGLVVQITAAIPEAVLVTGVGLAVIGVLTNALQRATSGPLIWGPLFAFAIALSDLTLIGMGPFFWAIVGGVGVSLLLERDEWKTLHDDRS